MRTIDDILKAVPSPTFQPLPAPEYKWGPGARVALAVASMKNHTSDEGWQIMQGLEANGYILQGNGLPYGSTNVPFILGYWHPVGVMVVQDKREYEGLTASGPRDFNQLERFEQVSALAHRPDVFKVTILKDAHQQPIYHAESAAEMGCHAWIVYYHPKIVHHLAPWTRSEHLIRTWHTVDPEIVPKYSHRGRLPRALLSGATGKAYPLREAIRDAHLHNVGIAPHPGYHRSGCCTPEYLQTLASFKVAICTSSIYGYALRKIVEATACGCRVITDLPIDDSLPEIDGNLVRLPDGVANAPGFLADLIDSLSASYDPIQQEHYSRLACGWYSYKTQGAILDNKIESLRRHYPLEVRP